MSALARFVRAHQVELRLAFYLALFALAIIAVLFASTLSVPAPTGGTDGVDL